MSYWRTSVQVSCMSKKSNEDLSCNFKSQMIPWNCKIDRRQKWDHSSVDKDSKTNLMHNLNNHPSIKIPFKIRPFTATSHLSQTNDHLNKILKKRGKKDFS